MSITPYSRYLSMPLHTTLMLMIIGFAALLTLGQHEGLPGISLFLIIASCFFKYSFVLLDHVIDGRTEPLMLSTVRTGFDQSYRCINTAFHALQQAKQHECNQYLEQNQNGPPPFAPDAVPDQRKIFHAALLAWLSASGPLSTCSWRDAYSAALGA